MPNGIITDEMVKEFGRKKLPVTPPTVPTTPTYREDWRLWEAAKKYPAPPEIPPEGIRFTMPNYRGQEVDAFLSQDKSVIVANKKIGDYNIKTDQIEFSDEYLKQVQSNLERDLKSFTIRGEWLGEVPTYVKVYGETKKKFEEAARKANMSVQNYMITSPADILQSLFAPIDLATKIFGAAVTAPFRPEGMITATKTPYEVPEKLIEKYEKWEEPVWWTGLPGAPEYKVKPTKGLVEFIPWLIVGGAPAKTAMQKLFTNVARIEAKQAAGKVLKASEEATLVRALKIETAISAQIAPKIAIPTIEELIAANYAPNIAAQLGQKLVKAPGIMGSVTKSLLPMQEAMRLTPRAEKILAKQTAGKVLTETEKMTLSNAQNAVKAKQATIAWEALRNDITPSLSRIEMEAVYAKDFPFKFAPAVYPKGKIPLKPLVEFEGLVKNVGIKEAGYKPYIQAIAEFPDRYVLNAAQRAELDLLDTLLSKQLAREIAAGVNVKPVGLKVGQRYIPRFVREIQDLETKALTEVRRGVSTRPGIKPSSFRTRYYEEVLEGIIQGKRYTTDLRAAVEMRLTAGNKAIADKMFADYLRPLGELPKARIPAAIRTAREDVVAKQLALRNVSNLIEQINAKATIDWPYWLGIKKWYPEQYAELRGIAKQGKAVPQKLKTWIVSEKAALKAVSKEVRPKYKLALAQARLSAIGKEGTINHAALQGEIFPIDVSSPVNELIRKEITTHQVLNQIAKVNDVARMGQTAIDTGIGLIQGQLTLFNNPKAWGKMWEIGLKTLVNPKYRAQYGVMNRVTETLIATHGGAAFGGSEFTLAARPGGWLGKIPVLGKVFKRFGHYFEATIDTARIELNKAYLPHYTRKLGRELTERELTDLVVSIDHMVGISSMSRLGMSKFIQVLARDTMYAPRYYLGYVSFLGRAFQGGIGGDLARRALPRWLIGSASFMSGMAVLLGQKERIIPTKDKPIPTMFDPTSGEFMSVEIAGTHMGLGGVWIAGLRLLGSLTKTAIDDPTDFRSIDPHENPFLRYGYGRASPVVSGAIDITTGKNYLGERLDSIDDYLRAIVDKTFPFWAAGQITDVPKAGWQKGMAEWFGLRAWMVQYREQAKRYAEEHIKDIPDEMVMPWQKEKISEGRPLRYEDLNNEQRAWLLLTFADYREAEDRRLSEKLRKGTDFEVADIKTREILDAVYQIDLEEVAKGVISGLATISDYQNQAEYLRRIRSGQYQYRAEIQKYIDEDRWDELQKWIEENQKPEDKAYDNYMELKGSPPKIAGVPDWETWEKNVNDYLSGLDTATREYILRKQDDWINNLPANAQKVQRLISDCETILDAYYEIPEGQPRLTYRDQNPEVDARLIILRGLKPRTGFDLAIGLLDKYGISRTILGEITPPAAVPPKPVPKPLPTPPRGGIITDEQVEAFGKK